jgi:hypothetical protein
MPLFESTTPPGLGLEGRTQSNARVSSEGRKEPRFLSCLWLRGCWKISPDGNFTSPDTCTSKSQQGPLRADNGCRLKYITLGVGRWVQGHLLREPGQSPSQSCSCLSTSVRSTCVGLNQDMVVGDRQVWRRIEAEWEEVSSNVVLMQPGLPSKEFPMSSVSFLRLRWQVYLPSPEGSVWTHSAAQNVFTTGNEPMLKLPCHLPLSLRR